MYILYQQEKYSWYRGRHKNKTVRNVPSRGTMRSFQACDLG